MSYARFSDESDVYVYACDGGGVVCEGCANEVDPTFTSVVPLIKHLKHHVQKGHKVPAALLNERTYSTSDFDIKRMSSFIRWEKQMEQEEAKHIEWLAGHPDRTALYDLNLAQEKFVAEDGYMSMAVHSNTEAADILIESDWFARRVGPRMSVAPADIRRAWHDVTCPEGKACEDRMLHTLSNAATVMFVEKALKELGIKVEEEHLGRQD